MLKGKGMFLFRGWEKLEAARLADDLADMGMNWLLIDYRTPADYARKLVAELRSRGIAPEAWGSLSHPSAAADEAIAAARFCIYNGIRNYVWDPENKWKAGVVFNRHGTDQQAQVLLDDLRRLVDSIKFSGAIEIGLCTYKYPRLHKELPWTTAIAHCDFFAPQVYWMKSQASVAELNRSRAEYGDLWQWKPVVPIGSAFSQSGWAASAKSLAEFRSAINEPAWGVWYADEVLSTDPYAYRGSSVALRMAWRQELS